MHIFIWKKKSVYTSVNQFKVKDSLVNITQAIYYKIKVCQS